MSLAAHWELKLVALVIAAALWSYTAGQVRSERTVTVVVAESSVKGLPDDLVVTGVGPHEFTVRLSLPGSREDEIPAQIAPRIELPAEAARKGVASLPITSRLLGLPYDVRILDIKPEGVKELRVGLDRIAEATLPVEPPPLAGLPPGLEATLALDLSLVRVRAPVETLERMQKAGTRIRFQPVPLDQEDASLASERQERVRLVPQAEGCRVLDAVSATVTVRPAPLAAPLTLVVPVEILASRDLLASFAIEVDPPRAVLKARGPENLVAGLRAEEDLVAYVHLREGLEPGKAHPLPLAVQAPAWLAIEPASVRVTLVPRSSER
jgi:hypothetical protein